MIANRLIRSSCLVLAVSLIATAGLAADGPDLGSDYVNDLAALEEKMVGLAEAIPADKFSFTPQEGVRTVSQSLMHTAAANFFFPMQAGIQPPEGVNVQTLETITDKAECIETLKKSFAQLKKLIESVPADKLGEAKTMFGQEMTAAGMLHAALSHNHEHLGQMIAYARSVGVAPPWSQYPEPVAHEVFPQSRAAPGHRIGVPPEATDALL